MVHPEMADQARLTLASEKVLPGGGIGFSTFLNSQRWAKQSFSSRSNIGLPKRASWRV
jgi:flagellar biosynthesis/type III secretory pathway M-ring protein FliF/YscJ